jgi:hypothetical protein
MITDGVTGVMWEEAIAVWCRVARWHLAGRTEKITVTCPKFVPGAQEWSISLIFDVLSCYSV